MKFLSNWISKMWTFGKSFSAPYTPENPTAPTVQEDTRSRESVKRFVKSFKQQQQELQIKALKPHGKVCLDILNCEKEKCFEWEADKIVNTIVIAHKRKMRTLKKTVSMEKK